MAEPPGLSASGEAAWQTLRQHAEWADGFWLAWVFTDHTQTADELRRRLAGQRMLPLSELELGGPPDIATVMAALLTGEAPAGDVWVRTRGPSEQTRDAWETLHLRLNERREALRERLPHGLVLVAPSALKAVTAHAAPDLWSIRSLVLEPQGSRRAASGGAPRPHQVDRHQAPQAPEDPVLAERGLRRAVAAGNPEAQAVAGTRLARARLEQGHPGEARDLAAQAVDMAQPGIARARALATLAEAEVALGDRVAAERHFGRAVEAGSAEGGAEAIRWEIERARLLHEAMRLEKAQAVAERAAARARELGEPGHRLLSVALNTLGDVDRDLGRAEQARDAYAESLDLRRRLRDALGDQPGVLRDLSVSLEKLGDVDRDLGRTEPARDAYAESLDLRRRLRDALGDQPGVLRDLAASLERLGNVDRDLGRTEQARDAYAEGLDLFRRLGEALGDQPGVLRDLSVSLEKLGDVEHDLGRAEQARDAYAESLGLRRRLRDALGDQPGVLRDLAASLSNLGDVDRDLGRTEQARDAYAESLDLCRRLRDALGDQPGVLRDLSVSLNKLGDVDSDLGRTEQARDAYSESLDLCRRLRDALGDQPGVLRDLSVSLGRLAMVSTGQERDRLAAECLHLAQAALAAAPLPANEQLVAWAAKQVEQGPAEE